MLNKLGLLPSAQLIIALGVLLAVVAGREDLGADRSQDLTQALVEDALAKIDMDLSELSGTESGCPPTADSTSNASPGDCDETKLLITSLGFSHKGIGSNIDAAVPLPFPTGPAIATCEARLSPTFEKLGDHLERHAYQFKADLAHKAVDNLRVQFFSMMNKCVELENAGMSEENEAEFQLQVDQQWGVIKKHIVEPIKKNVVDPVKKKVVDPAVKWVKNGPPAPPPGNPPKTYSSWKAVQVALALSSLVYQEESAIDWFISGCPDPNKSTRLKTVVGKVDQKSLDLMTKFCKLYTMFKKIAFLDNGRSANGKDVGTEALFLEMEERLIDGERPTRRLLEMSEDNNNAAALQDVEQAGMSHEQAQQAARWWSHRHTPHKHRPHTHNPHKHSPHKHRPHVHNPHTHNPHKHTAPSPTSAKSIWIVIRGSEDREDWKSNIKITVDEWKDGGGGEVHSGFLKQYGQIRRKLFETVDQYINNGVKQFIFAGHSLGGAVAEMCTMAIKQRHPTADVQLISFGAPMVGNPTFVKAFDSKISRSTRIVNNKDIITCLPGHNPVSQIGARVAGLFSKGSISNPFTENVDHLLQWSNNAWRSKRWPSCARSWSVSDHGILEYAQIVLGHPRGGFDLAKLK